MVGKTEVGYLYSVHQEENFYLLDDNDQNKERKVGEVERRTRNFLQYWKEVENKRIEFRNDFKKYYSLSLAKVKF